MATSRQIEMKPIMPRWGASSVNPEQARRKAEERRGIKHSKKAAKKRKGK